MRRTTFRKPISLVLLALMASIVGCGTVQPPMPPVSPTISPTATPDAVEPTPMDAAENSAAGGSATAPPPTPTPTPSPTPAPRATRIQFEPGASSDTVTGYVEQGGYRRYVLRAMEGQVMEAVVSSPDDGIGLSAWGEDGTNLRYLPQSAWCGRLPATQDYYVDVVPSGGSTAYTLTVAISPETLTTPPMVLIEPRTPTRAVLPVDPPRLHFLGADGFPEIVALAEHVALAKPELNANPRWPFQVAGGRVYYGDHYADPGGVAALPVPDVLDTCHAPLVSPAGTRLAWLCTDMTGAGDAAEGDYHFELVLTDGEGHDPHAVWSHTESGPDYAIPHLVSWQEGGAVIYLAWRGLDRLDATGRQFGYHPGMLAVRTGTGEERPIGSPDAGDAAVSADGSWLVQAFPGPEAEIRLRSLTEGTERTIAGTEGAREIGDFSFAPGNAWLAWQAYTAESSATESSATENSAAGDSATGTFRLRAMRLPDGSTEASTVSSAEPPAEVGESLAESPATIYEVDEDDVYIHTIAGWMGPNQLVVVRTEERALGSSYLVTLPSEGPGCKLSSYDFLGVLEEDIRVADYPSVGFLNVDVNYTGTWYRETFGYTRRAKNVKHLVLVAPESVMRRASAAEIFTNVRFPTEPGWLGMKKDELSWALAYLHLAPEGHFRGQFEPGTYYVAGAFIAAPISKEEAGHADDVVLYPGITGGGASTDYREVEIGSGENELQIDLTDSNGWACPWLYAHNGRRFERRTEILRNVRGKQNERVEVSHVGPVKVIDGSVILRIAEEKKEVSFIDELTIVVDGVAVHPETGSAAAVRVAARDRDRLRIAAGQSYKFAFALPASLADKERVEVTVVASGYYVSE